MKALDRKVWLPSGGSLVIDRTEAMTVVDVNTGKFTGQGGNLEETVTRNNLEAAEEIVRQLRLRDIGGIIVIDFIDMVLESNRELVLRRLLECLGRDRTKHQVAEVTSLGLVQMTRKKVGQGLLEAFSEGCEHCAGRGIVVKMEQAEVKEKPSIMADRGPRPGRRRRGRSGGGDPLDLSADEIETLDESGDADAVAPEVVDTVEAVAEAVADAVAPHGRQRAGGRSACRRRRLRRRRVVAAARGTHERRHQRQRRGPGRGRPTRRHRRGGSRGRDGSAEADPPQGSRGQRGADEPGLTRTRAGRVALPAGPPFVRCPLFRSEN